MNWRFSLPVSALRHLFHLAVVLLLFIPWPIFLRPGLDITDARDFLPWYWFVFVLSTLPFYIINVYWLVPLVLQEGRYLIYVMAIALCLIVSAQVHMRAQMPARFLEETPRPAFFKRAHLFPTLLLLMLGTSFEMVLGWEKQRRKTEEIEKEKIKAELSFLKSQINPHFLFNSLNNIYSLSEKKSDAAGESVLRLSEMMRYVLYDSNHGKVPLDKEVAHLENYVSMQRLRVSPVENISISFKHEGPTSNILIEPLILIPFVENAFKHGLSYNHPSRIDIRLLATNKKLEFFVSNLKRENQTSSKTDEGGIGVQNTRRRLDLLYAGRYSLTINNGIDQYATYLAINLTEAEIGYT